jgi:predicted ATPase/DNA-binding SARP family transcriptional activator
MEIRVLGPLEVADAEGALVELRGAKLNGLLVLLALRAGAVVPTTRIIEALWGDKDIRDPANAVQVLVSKLRRSLSPLETSGRLLIVTSAVGYSLEVDPTTVDAVRFEGLAREGRRLLERGLRESAAVVLRKALALWRGAALADFAYAEFARGDRARLEELRASTLELRIEADLDLGRHEELVGELEALVADHPLRERLRAQQMLALYRCGRQADALRVFQTTRSHLGEELGLEPGPELQRLESAILAQDPSLDVEPGAAVERRSGNLRVPISSFVGRSAEVAQVRELLAKHRLVTLTGPGGAGKSRLALEVATLAKASMPGGGWLVELASLTDAGQVGAAVATAIGLDDLSHLDEYVTNREMLILLDNCEHLIEGAAAIAARLLHSGAGVVVLATSREGLGVTGERRWSVPPMTVDDATALFADRSAGHHGSGEPEQAAIVGEICGRLDGLPLAVELAAARTRTLSLRDIAARLDDRFRLLTTGDRNAAPRQRTLRDVVDWSHDLLFVDEQRVFRRLSVFAGGFGIAAAEFVASGDDVPISDVVDIVGHLVDKSLVARATRAGDTRFHLLQTFVDYGQMRLLEAGEEEQARTRHLAWTV